ncbi:hypothetical protein M0R72_13380 [Candidatus Pacearchaeota archaeon]|jgi:hypothetical protein|nr:hypothetical protein [Candidatus Pacearchaeota archaeon]
MITDHPARVTVLRDSVETFGLRVEGRGRHASDAAVALIKRNQAFRYDRVEGFRVYGTMRGIRACLRELRERGILHELVFSPQMDGVQFDPEAGV